MNNEQATHQQIEDFLNGNLNGKDLLDFELRIKNDASLAEEVEYHRLVDEIVVEDALRPVSKRLTEIHLSSSGSGTWKLLAGLLVLLSLGSVVYWSNMQSHSNKFFSELDATVISEFNSENNRLPTSEKIENFADRDLEDQDSREAGVVDDFHSESVKSVVVDEKVTSKLVEVNEPEREDVITDIKEGIKPCKDVNISANLIIENTCIDLNNGVVSFNTSTVLGGKGPYSYSLLSSSVRVKKKNIPFTNKVEYKDLDKGYYNVFIKDINGCVSYSPKAAYVGESHCVQDVREIKIDVRDNDSWLIKNENKSKGELIVLDREENILLNQSIESGKDVRWYGKDSSGQFLKSGKYPFELRYLDGNISKGVIEVE